MGSKAFWNKDKNQKFLDNSEIGFTQTWLNYTREYKKNLVTKSFGVLY